MKSNKKGITLIALVITIIVLLILAGITINLTIGQDGILKRTQEAGENYTNAAEYEQIQLAEFSNIADNIIANLTGRNEGTTVALASKAEPGDYVEYTPTATIFSMTPEQTGQDVNQDFNTADYTGLWQVLYNDTEHGLQIISAGSVGKLTLGHADSDGSSTTRTAEDEEKVIRAYNNSINTLNSFCRNYVNTSYASSGRSVGSDPISPDDTITNPITLQFTPNGYTSGNVGVHANNDKYSTDYNAMTAVTNQSDSGICDIGSPYWLASRWVISGTGDAYLVVRFMSDASGAKNSSLWQVNSNGRFVPA